METGKILLNNQWKINGTQRALNTYNSIRRTLQTMKMDPNYKKSLIPLSLGDPTVFGNLPPSDATLNALHQIIDEGHSNGYFKATGCEYVREVLADYYSNANYKFNKEDVILSNGCSGALDLAIGALCEENTNLLIPRPGFQLSKTLCEVFNVNVKSYNLKPCGDWNVDLDSLEELIDENTSAILFNNPSNPCGSVWTKSHIQELLAVAERHRIPLIIDEIYAEMVFEDIEFHSFSSLSQNVPMLICGGVAKRFLVPGWRVGWVLVFDRNNAFPKIRDGLNNLTQRLLGPNSICQAAIPKMLSETKLDFFSGALKHLERNGKIAFDMLSEIDGIHPIMPKGAMYMMVGFDPERFPHFESDIQFTEQLISEESVVCLPGSCFDYPFFFRIVLCLPNDQMEEACGRIQEFCKRH